MKHAPVLPRPTLAEVQSRFADWRKNKKHRKRIPEDLWVAAVMLNPEHSIHKISRTLRLGYTDLKKRVESHQSPDSSSPLTTQHFIPIDMAPIHSAECIIEMEHRNGNKMRMHFKGEADLDLQSFSESFWSVKACSR